MHAACATPGNDTCPQCWAPLTGVFAIYERCASTMGRPSNIVKIVKVLRCANIIGCEIIVKIVLWRSRDLRAQEGPGNCQDCEVGGAAKCAHKAIQRMRWECHRFRLQKEDGKEKDHANTGLRTRE
jgi:hypothetical protein